MTAPAPVEDPMKIDFVCDCTLEPGEARGIYLVTDHHGETSVCAYCETCAELAECDWNGETAAIEPVALGPVPDGEDLNVAEFGELLEDGVVFLRPDLTEAAIDGRDLFVDAPGLGRRPIWSVGRSKWNGSLWAAFDGRFYQNPDYDCVWLR